MRKNPLACLVLLLASSCATRPASVSVSDGGASVEPSLDDCHEDPCVRSYGRLLGDRPPVVRGADVDITNFGGACRVQVAWRVGGERGVRFQATPPSQVGVVFPLPDGLAKMRYCWGVRTMGDHSSPPVAGLLLDPNPSLPRLARGDAFIPLRGEATLDGDLYASAHVEQTAPTHGAPLSVSIGIKPTRSKGASFSGLRAGDGFVWGSHPATVVRIVVSTNVIAGSIEDGWVEVSLS